MDHSSQSAARATETPDDAAPLRVLVVDDQEIVRTAVAALLTARGFATTVAEDGEHALALLRSDSFDVMLCDIRMPGIDGLDVLTQALEIDPRLPVLMLTAVNDMGTARDAIKRGAMDYLTKPIEMDDLDQAVRSAANYHRQDLKEHATPDEPHTEEFTLLGGPLADSVAKVERRTLRLWVILDGDVETVWAAEELPTGIPVKGEVVGCYAYAEEKDAMVWEPYAA